jgi:hypothetical protein
MGGSGVGLDAGGGSASGIFGAVAVQSVAGSATQAGGDPQRLMASVTEWTFDTGVIRRQSRPWQ